MLHKAVREWLSEYKALGDDEILTFSQMLWQNTDLIDALYKLFDSKASVENLDPVCHQLFEFYRSNHNDLKRFSLEYLPSLIFFYLSSVSQNEKKSCGGVEAFLLGLYNLEIVDSTDVPKINTFRIPSFGQPSVYHEPLSLSHMQPLTESALSRFTLSQDIWRSGPHSEFETINGQNRPAILAYLMECYNNHIVTLTSHSHRSLCLAASRIARIGFSGQMFSQPSDLDSLAPSETRNGLQPEVMIPRIPVSPALLVEMLSGVYYVMFNGQTTVAIHAVEDIHSRAGYEMFADVQLVTSAILNSLKFSPSSQPEDGPMGISVAISTNIGIAKSAITNASFRAKKLPDDISVPTTLDSKLQPIDEDSDATSLTQITNKSGRFSGKRANLFKKDKDKDKVKVKEKEKVTRKDSDVSIKSVDGASMSGKSLVTNGDSLDSVSVSVISNQGKSVVDNIELVSLSKTSVGDDEYLVANGCSEEFAPSEMPKSVSASPSVHKEIKNGPVNTESLSTDL
ncbi:hyccin-like [Gigantopelta aegis]|uniref:hyccin-like n=1 Tax=Gigantopelta aegis TaxID=1735272 RepID=UPI001B88B05D|nr:hyccin-like [Gigantopelta aegis]